MTDNLKNQLIITNLKSGVTKVVTITDVSQLKFGYNNIEKSALMFVVDKGVVLAEVSNVLNHVLRYYNCNLDFIMSTEVNGINYLYRNVNELEQLFVVRDTSIACEFQIWRKCKLEMAFNNLLNTTGSYFTNNDL